MSDIIRLLPDSVANQIAAGEVIQRPASVLKELVENAVDAGATEIRIIVKDAGRTLLQVIDNGRGMSETDARMAFERHATSKISEAADLFSLHTMGFRGEALPSICAISEVEITTRPHEGETGTAMGTRLVIRGSHVETQEPVVCAQGTNIAVRDLFYNVPARRKFLKSDSVELSNLMREFERLALVNNHVRMTIDTSSRVIDLRSATLKQRIHDIWKNNLNMQLVPVHVDTSLVKVEGFLSRPEFARRRNPLQFLIVNGRNMRHPYFHKAIVSCFDGLIAADTQPCYFVKFQVDPSTIDVNIHPTKSEIKFEYEQQIWPILVAAVKAALGKYAAVPSIDFDTDVVPVAPLHQGEVPDAPGLDISKDYNPFAEPSAFETPRGMPGGVFEGSRRHGRAAATRGWESLYADFMRQTGRGRDSSAADTPGDTRGDVAVTPSGASPDGTVFESAGPVHDGAHFTAAVHNVLPEGGESAGAVGAEYMQYGLKYILTATREGVMVIDQHRAHVRILYEQCLRRIERQEGVSQRVMFPETLRLDPSRQSALEAVGGELSRLGFELEYEEDDRWRIMAHPVLLRENDTADIVLRLLDSVSEDSPDYGADGCPVDSMLQRTALLMARAAAIRGGQRLSADEMEHIVGELFSLPDSALTPDGHRIYTVITPGAIESMLP